MTGLNLAVVVGHLGKAPKVRRAASGPIANLQLCTNARWYDRETKQARESTEWHTIVVFGEGLVNWLEQNVRKGALLAVQGRLHTNTWTDNDRVQRLSTEIVVGWGDGKISLLWGGRKSQADAEPSLAAVGA